MNVFPALLASTGAPRVAYPGPAHVIRIGRVGPQDLPQLSELLRAQREEVLERPAARSAMAALELSEALFDPPVRAWAWIARQAQSPMGYAFATVGYSLLDDGYYLRLEALHVELAWRQRGVEMQLLDAARATATELGCRNLQWQDGAHLPRLSVPGVIYRHAAAHVLPLADAGACA